MTVYDLIGILLTLAAIFGYLNHRYLKLPTTIGLMIIALGFSALLILADLVGLELREQARAIITGIDFNQTLMQGMLSFLLFAGALHIKLDDLSEHKAVIAAFATFGVTFCTIVIGLMMFYVLKMLGLELPMAYCLLFGALISPTDPIAVLGLLKQAKAPKALETKIAGESLFNDGVGVVIFIILYEMLEGGGFDPGHAVTLLVHEGVGGLLLGLILGWIAYKMLRSVDNYQVEILITLALVTGGYALAGAFHMSGPLMVVAAGLLMGNRGRTFAMSEQTRMHLDTFWELVDEILNAVLFVLIGLEILIISLRGDYLIAGVIAIPLVLLARFVGVGLPVALFSLRKRFSPHVVKILTWGGLRGGISVALALSLPPGEPRDLILTITYVVVVFSIVVQGLSLPVLLRKTVKA